MRSASSTEQSQSPRRPIRLLPDLADTPLHPVGPRRRPRNPHAHMGVGDDPPASNPPEVATATTAKSVDPRHAAISGAMSGALGTLSTSHFLSSFSCHPTDP